MSEQRARTPAEIVRDLQRRGFDLAEALRAALDREQQRTRETCGTCAEWADYQHPDRIGLCTRTEHVEPADFFCAAYTTHWAPAMPLPSPPTEEP